MGIARSSGLTEPASISSVPASSLSGIPSTSTTISSTGKFVSSSPMPISVSGTRSDPGTCNIATLPGDTPSVPSDPPPSVPSDPPPSVPSDPPPSVPSDPMVSKSASAPTDSPPVVSSSDKPPVKSSSVPPHTTPRSTPTPESTKANAALTRSATSTTVQVIHDSLPSTVRTSTSTITDPPEATLSKPSFIPIVADGKTSFIAPPLVTIFSTSREANGSFLTFTHVVANPTGFAQAISGGHVGFIHNAGAVAGVFLVVGAIVAGVTAAIAFILCRRRRRRLDRHRRWLMSINRPRPSPDQSQYPFQQSQMRDIDPGPTWNNPVPASNPEGPANGLGLFDVPPAHHNEASQESQYTRRHGFPKRGEALGLAVMTNFSKPSLAQSSPSIYPPSLPPANDDPFEEVQEKAHSRAQRDTSPPPPPRPRRSHLRDKSPLLTPPSSISETSHSPISEFNGPFGFTPVDSEPQGNQLNEIMGRKTLLDVRPRMYST